MSHTPTLFIGIGETGAFFTLRETYEHTSYIPGMGDYGNAVVNGVYQGTVQKEIRSFHHFNLSQDPAEAFEKASRVAEEMGLELVSTLDDIRTQLREIQRATAEELERRKREAAEREAFWAAERAAREEKARADLLEGRVSFGRKEGRRFEELPGSYLEWVVEKETDFEEGSLMRAMAVAIRTKFAHLLPPKALPNSWAGEIGKRLTFNVVVTRVHSFDRPCYGASWRTERCHIVTMVTDEGVCLVSKGTSFRAEAGERLKLKATVKDHDRYRDQAQTVIQRIAVLGEIE